MAIQRNPAAQAALDKKLMDAAIADDASKVKSLLAKGASAKSTDEEGFTPLMWAARYDLVRVVEILLCHSDLDQACKDGRCALAIAQEGAGAKTLSATYIQTYQAAERELAELASQTMESKKQRAPKFRL